MSETMNYPAQCWYVAATTDEVDSAPLGRRILGRDVVLWRAGDGHVVALDDRCAHRGLPLSHGTPAGDTLICGYHGCTYDTKGVCVHVPTQPDVPTGMSVHNYPVFEEAPFIWIWPGPAAASTGTRPPSISWLADPAWGSFGNTWQVRANYLMAHEHYLDFSYASVLHREGLPPGIERIPSVDTVEVTETTVSYRRSIPSAPLAAWESGATGLDPQRSYARSESGLFASPALHVQRWEIEADGTTYSNVRIHAITPESPDSTHIFMRAAWNYRPDSRPVAEALEEFVDGLVIRDRDVLDTAAARVGYDGWRSSVEFQADTAALEARRIVAVMLAKEAGRAALRPGVAARPLLSLHHPSTSAKGAQP